MKTYRKTSKIGVKMQAFVILHKDNEEGINDIRKDTVELTDLSKKTEILNQLDMNYSSLNFDDYRFFDESELYNKNKIYEEYMDSVFEVYFPSKWDAPSQKYLYTPEEKIIKEDSLTIYTYKWRQLKFDGKMKKLYYLREDDKSPRRTLFVFSENQ